MRTGTRRHCSPILAPRMSACSDLQTTDSNAMSPKVCCWIDVMGEVEAQDKQGLSEGEREEASRNQASVGMRRTE
jgi:hypothetical protein